MRTQDTHRLRRFVVLSAIAALVAVAPAFAGERAGYHKHVMKGSILSTHEHSVYLCIGTERGATAGQVLDVVRVVRVTGGSPKAAVRYVRRHIGKIRIESLVDRHFAHATIVEGEAHEGNIVELKG